MGRPCLDFERVSGLRRQQQCQLWLPSTVLGQPCLQTCSWTTAVKLLSALSFFADSLSQGHAREQETNECQSTGKTRWLQQRGGLFQVHFLVPR